MLKRWFSFPNSRVLWMLFTTPVVSKNLIRRSNVGKRHLAWVIHNIHNNFQYRISWFSPPLPTELVRGVMLVLSDYVLPRIISVEKDHVKFLGTTMRRLLKLLLQRQKFNWRPHSHTVVANRQFPETKRMQLIIIGTRNLRNWVTFGSSLDDWEPNFSNAPRRLCKASDRRQIGSAETMLQWYLVCHTYKQSNMGITEMTKQTKYMIEKN